MAFSQEKQMTKEYCSVRFNPGGLGKSYASIMKDDHGFIAINDSVGKRIKFNTEIQLFNYMSKQGWELHPISINYQGDDGKYYEYVFWRYVKEEKEGE